MARAKCENCREPAPCKSPYAFAGCRLYDDFAAIDLLVLNQLAPPPPVMRAVGDTDLGRRELLFLGTLFLNDHLDWPKPESAPYSPDQITDYAEIGLELMGYRLRNHRR